ncbi:MAG TPA: IPT/TIG domain-containing protein [Anaerolineales bacterium]|nr:IPT/TIG domain-containing protein [Anaerolineales bacterium]
MKQRTLRLISLALLIALALASIPVPGYAATLTSITPSTVVNDVSNLITVSGSGFNNTAVVLANGFALDTTFLNDQTLRAEVPAGFPSGTYTITVSMTGDTVSGSATLTVLDPTPVPPTPTPTATSAPLPFARPQFVVRSSRAVDTVQTGKEFRLKVVLENAGNATAYNTQVVFSSADLVPTKNGGVAVLGTVNADDEVDASQTFLVAASLVGKSVLVADLTVTYYDSNGTSYSDKFTLSIPVSGGSVPSGGPYYTPTPTGIKSSQLVITDYSTDVDPLEPGEQFTLTMTIRNMGNARAQRVTMIVGGGSSGSNGGTPQPSGVSGGSGEFTNFAPVGASNVQSLGDVNGGDTIQASQSLIVNVSTNPGAYPMKITFSYLNDKGEVINDEQVITLLVYSLPKLDIGFYRPLDPFFVGQPGALPFQVVNLGKRTAVLGTMKVEAEGGTIENGTSLVGALDAGGYFTLDSMLIPERSGTIALNITIDYTDDFNQPRTITRTLEVEVMEGFIETPIDPSLEGGGELPPPSEENFWQKVWRFILGLLGLDSAPPSDGNPGEVPPIEEPIHPLPGGGKG